MKSGTQDQVEGKFHKLRGKFKEIAGKLGMNFNLEAEGKDEKIAGAKCRKRSARSRRSWGNSESGASCAGASHGPWTTLH